MQWFSNCAPQDLPQGLPCITGGEGGSNEKGQPLPAIHQAGSCWTFFCVICLPFHVLLKKGLCGAGKHPQNSYPGWNDDTMSKKVIQS